jgi:phosphohistidine phosphatase
MPNQRHIILLRHAHAEPPTGSQANADFDRALSVTGLKQAADSAAWVHEHLKETPRILSSTSARTRATAAALSARFPHANVHFLDKIYEASAGVLIEVLAAEHHSPLILIGHNPGLESLLALLSTGQSSAARGMSPGSVAWLTTALKKDLTPGCAELKLFWSP